MVRQNKQLDHKNSENDSDDVVLIEFNGDDQRYCQKDISGTYGNEGKKEGFIFRFADSQRNHFAHDYKIEDTENCTENQTFTHRPLAGQNKEKAYKDGSDNGSGTVFLLCFPKRVHCRNCHLFPFSQ
jgi:hypothetical protein